jgi:hypothetical protein
MVEMLKTAASAPANSKRILRMEDSTREEGRDGEQVVTKIVSKISAMRERSHDVSREIFPGTSPVARNTV